MNQTFSFPKRKSLIKKKRRGRRMKWKRRNITPHEADQPIAGIAEAISDSDAMQRVWEEKEQRAAKPTLSSSITPKRLLSPKTRFLRENGFLKSNEE